MPETVFLIDGMYLLFSSFYANPHMRTLEGEPTGAVFGFINRTESLIRELEPQRIAVAFDSKEKTFRHQMFEQYKAKRQVPPEDLVKQIPYTRQYLQHRGIRLFEVGGFEADDLIASLARKEAEKGNEVVIFSGDKDLFQLVKDSIYIYHPKQKQKLDSQGVEEFFGVTPSQVVDYLSLTGDTSDNIPGVPGVGDKTAKKLIENFGSVQQFLDKTDLAKSEKKLQQKLIDNMESYRMSRQLIDLDNAPQVEEDLTIDTFKNNIEPELLEFYQRLSFNSLLKRFGGKTEPKKTTASDSLDIQYHMVKRKEQLKEIAHAIKKEKRFAFDLETTELAFYKSKIVGLSISFNDRGYYIPFLCSEAERNDIEFTQEDFVKEFRELFEDPKIEKTGHNLKFDMLHLIPAGIHVRGAKDDSMVMAYLIHPNRRAHKLKDLTLELLNYKQTHYQELTGKGKDQRQLITVDLETVGKYCIDDSHLTLKLVEELSPQLKEKELVHLYETIEMPLVDVLTWMEYEGVKVDVSFLKQAAKEMKERIATIEKEIYEMAGYKFNINSSQQLGELLFEKMNLPVKKRTRKTKSYSTDNEVLSELKDHKVVAKVIDYRTYKKLLSTYLVGLLDNIDQDQRIHTSYNQTVTATGRLSSSDPNLQNIPVGSIGGINVRDAFVAEEGEYLLAADYSQVELRVMAHFSKDPNLVEAFACDFDIHKHTADTVFNKDLFTTEQEKRKRAKIINFSVLYGTGPYSLSKELGVSYQDAKNFIDMYFDKHTGVKQFIDQTIANAEKEPEVKTISGRYRPIPEILSANRTVKENGKRMAINTVIQGSAADIIKIAMINIHRKLEESGMKSKLIMQVHDELIFRYPPEEEAKLFRLVKDLMENAFTLEVPLKVDMKKGKTWGTMDKVTI